MRLLLAVACAATVLPGCGIGDVGEWPEVVRTVTPVTTTTESCPAQPFDPVEPSSVLVPGPTDGVQPAEVKSDTLIVAAAVLAPACVPASGANLTIWHTDANGQYGPAGPNSCCYYKTTGQTDGNGRFRLETIRPGQYAQHAHIHVRVEHPSGGLDTEFVFVSTGDTRPPNARAIPVPLRQLGEPSAQHWYGEATIMLRRRP